MKHPFAFSLKGREWFPLWAMMLVPTLLLQGLSLLVKAPADPAASQLGYLGLTLAVLFLQVLVTSWFQVPILATLLDRLSVGGKSPRFRGDSLTFTAMNAVGFLLSVVTVGIYLPWYLRRVTAYLVGQTEWDGVAPEFRGRALPLLGIFVLWFVIMFVLAIAAVTPVVLVGGTAGTGGANLAITAVTFALVVVLVGPLMYLVYRWMVNLTWNGLVVRWDTKFWRSIGMILGQSVLAVVTLGIYLPAAFLRLFRYFVGKTVAEKDGVAVVRLSFEGRLGQGFGLVWGQLLLTVVTLGFYWPWALEKVGAWLAAGTSADEAADIPAS